MPTVAKLTLFALTPQEVTSASVNQATKKERGPAEQRHVSTSMNVLAAAAMCVVTTRLASTLSAATVVSVKRDTRPLPGDQVSKRVQTLRSVKTTH